jgi:hypothetical protein
MHSHFMMQSHLHQNREGIWKKRIHYDVNARRPREFSKSPAVKISRQRSRAELYAVPGDGGAPSGPRSLGRESAFQSLLND